MLTLTRKPGGTIRINDDISTKVLSVSGHFWGQPSASWSRWLRLAGSDLKCAWSVNPRIKSMSNLPLQGRSRIGRNTSSLSYPPQKSSGHRLASSLGVCLFVNDSKVFRVNAQKQLRNTLSRKAGLDINNDAVIQHLTMGSVMQLAIGPQPKCRSTMRHFLSAPILGEPSKYRGRLFRYVQRFWESTGSYKRYRCNVLAGLSRGADGASVAIWSEAVHG